MRRRAYRFADALMLVDNTGNEMLVSALSDFHLVAIIKAVRHALCALRVIRSRGKSSAATGDTNQSRQEPACARNPRSGQVAQVVERSPEKAGVGGSTPSLATKIIHLQ